MEFMRKLGSSDPTIYLKLLALPRASANVWFASALRALRGDIANPHCVGPSARSHTVVEVGLSSAPGVLALVRVMLSRTVIT
jgi:hypothetical protein